MLQRAPFLVQLRHAGCQFVQPAFGHRLRFLRAGKLRVEIDQPRFVGRIQRIAVSRKTLVAQAQRARLLFNIALVGGQHLDLLLHLGHAGALLAGLGLSLAQRFIQRWRLRGVLFVLRHQQLGLFFGLNRLGGQAFGLDRRVFLARRPLGGLLFQLGQALLDAQPAIHHKADFRLQPADFGAGLVELALRLVDVIAGRIVRLPHGFQVGFNVAQVSHPAFQIVDGFFSIGLDLGLVGFGLGALQEPQLVLLERAVGLQRVVAQGDGGLLFEPLQIGIELAQDVFDAGQVFARAREPVGGLAATLFVLGNTGGFF